MILQFLRTVNITHSKQKYAFQNLKISPSNVGI